MNTKLFFASLFFGTILSATAQTITSFEATEGFNLGEISNQNGWTLVGATMPSANALIVGSNNNNSLKVIGTNTRSSSALIGVSSPNYNITGSQITVSLDIFIDASGESNNYIEVEDENSQLTSSVLFAYTRNIIVTSKNANGNLVQQDTHAFWAPGEWINLKVAHDFSANTIKYYINGELKYLGTTIRGTKVGKLVFRYDNYNSGFSIDNIQVGATVLGVKENELASRFSIYPNPTTDVINISNKNVKITGVILTDLNGRTVKQLSYDNLSHVTVNTTDLSAGMYLMNIKSSEGSATKKIVKN